MSDRFETPLYYELLNELSGDDPIDEIIEEIIELPEDNENDENHNHTTQESQNINDGY